jgi:Uracil-DNA glycosylase
MKREALPDYLYEKSSMVKPYPTSLVVPVTEMLDVTAFFPGGRGLWKEEVSEVFPSILILGHDFSTVTFYEKMRAAGTNEINGPTWRNLIHLFYEVDLNLSNCFFSNVYMGLRNSTKMTGTFPGSRDKAFVNRNLEFLRFQIETIQPKIIITLGMPPASLLSNISSDLVKWKDGKAFSIADNGIVFNTHFDNINCTCIALEHPSMRNSNVKRRSYRDFTGNDAEIRMLKDALALIIQLRYVAFFLPTLLIHYLLPSHYCTNVSCRYIEIFF